VIYRKWIFKHRNKLYFILIVLGSWWVCQNFGYAINLTQSLPYKCFLVHLHGQPAVGDHITFKAPSYSGLPANATLTKKIIGKPGDKVVIKGQEIFINNQWIATVKTHSLQGEPLQIGPQGIIGKGQYYVATPHKDSFDSRYQRIGWISEELIIGVAYPLW
jgi:conjugal transfer pilin signal peptidase TrbI